MAVERSKLYETDPRLRTANWLIPDENPDGVWQSLDSTSSLRNAPLFLDTGKEEEQISCENRGKKEKTKGWRWTPQKSLISERTWN